MKNLTILLLLSIYPLNLILGEELRFHVSTNYGEDLSGAEIRILDDTKTSRRTGTDGLCTIWAKTDKFQDITISVQKAGWTVIQPLQKNIFTVSYRDKINLIEIVMQQTIKLEPIIIATPDTNDDKIQAKELIRFYIQLKASASKMANSEKVFYQKKIGFEILEVYSIDGEFYPYKYRIALNSSDKKQANEVLKRMKSTFPDAFLIEIK